MPAEDSRHMQTCVASHRPIDCTLIPANRTCRVRNLMSRHITNCFLQCLTSRAVDTGRGIFLSRTRSTGNEAVNVEQSISMDMRSTLTGRYEKKGVILHAQDRDIARLVSHLARTARSSQWKSSIGAFYNCPAMDTLDKSDWDVVIAGTGIHQSLLALYVDPQSVL